MQQDKSRFDGYAGAIHFWDGSRYVLAYTSSSIFETEEDAEAGQSIDTVDFNPDALSSLSAAHVSWRHVVQSGETVERISTKYSTEAEEIIRQNTLSGPNGLRVGQELIYDSARTKDGKHSNKALQPTR
ncbi:MAG TPA: LysM domain-containing protein [bacterium]